MVKWLDSWWPTQSFRIETIFMKLTFFSFHGSPVASNQEGNQGYYAIRKTWKFFVHSYVTFPFTGRCLRTRAMTVCTRAPYCHSHAFVGSRLISMGPWGQCPGQYPPGPPDIRCPRAKQTRTPMRLEIVGHIFAVCGLFARVIPPCR